MEDTGGMLTRGYFIGEIVDAFSDISGRASTRARLGLLDLNKYLEDFARRSLNILYGLALVDLNVDGPNYPGLDLGDRAAGRAFQITSERTSKKVNDTLAKLTADQIAEFPRVNVLILGTRQATYSLDQTEMERTGFVEEDIWDLDTLCRKCVDLPVDTLQALYEHIRSELTTVRIELEVPDADGRYPTSVADYVEAVPVPTMTDLLAYRTWLTDNDIEEPADAVSRDFEHLARRLALLPRITRDFLVVMIDHRERERRGGIGSWERLEVNADKLDRMNRYPDSEGELRILATYGFARYDEADERGESAYWRLFFPGTSDGFELSFLEYARQRSLPIARSLVSLDFSGF